MRYTQSQRRTALTAATIAAAAAALVAATGSVAAGATAVRPRAAAAPPLATCFWVGPISMRRRTTGGFDGTSFNYPEASATYWLARFSLPPGASLALGGRYAHARYVSINSYSDGAPTDALSDIAIRPERGSTNPFVAGNLRTLRRRSFRVTVLDAAPPADDSGRAPNTLYAKPAPGAGIELLWRVYEPDTGRDLTGGAGLPAPAVRLADGRVLRGVAACRAINDPDRSVPVKTVSASLWRSLATTPGCDPATAPAPNPARFERFFSLNYATQESLLSCTLPISEVHSRLAPLAKVVGGLYSNRDSAYIYAHLSRRFGPVFVLRGRMPVFQATDGGRRMPGGQLRFWSLCSNESRVTVRTVACLADYQVPLGPGRRYTIVVSRRADRPANATARCGVAWLDWGLRGDGAGRPDYGLLIMRNMLASPRFARAIQRVRTPGTEPRVMGPYFPASRYTTRSRFQALGCHRRR